MATTYEPIATTTLTGTQANIEFTSISGAYTDFILTGTVVRTAASDIEFVLGNGSYDTGSNYSFTYLYGTGSVAGSGRASSQTKGNAGYASSTNPMSLTIQAQNYSNTSTYKTLLIRNSPASGDVSALVNLWRSTSAINQIKLTPLSGSFGAGTSLTIYGIAAA